MLALAISPLSNESNQETQTPTANNQLPMVSSQSVIEPTGLVSTRNLQSHLKKTAPQRMREQLKPDTMSNLSINDSEPTAILRSITKITEPQSRFEVLQKWEGFVANIEGDEITAVISDLFNANAPTEEICFDIDEVSDADRELVTQGAVFYWYIGYRYDPWGQKTRSSLFKFRRLPAWQKKQLDKADKDAHELFVQLSQE